MSDLKKKSRLGRGISSLMGIGEAGVADAIDFDASHGSVGDSPLDLPRAFHRQTPPAPPTPEVLRGTPALIPLTRIVPNPRQPRRMFDEVNLASLAASIQANGLIQPITLKPVGDAYQLIAGERRFRAAKLAGLTEIPAFLRDADDLAQAQMALVENIQREDLNMLDRAEGYRVLIHELGLSQIELATRIGEDRTTITNHLRLLELPGDVQTLLREGTLSLGHAKVLCGLQDPAKQSRLAHLVVTQSLSVRNLERLLTTPLGSSPTTPVDPKSPHIRDLEVSMSKQLGLRVNVKASTAKGKGKVVIHYNSLDEFDVLLGKMGVSVEE